MVHPDIKSQQYPWPWENGLPTQPHENGIEHKSSTEAELVRCDKYYGQDISLQRRELIYQ